MAQDTISPSIKLFKILADETRIKLLAVLRSGEFTVSELVSILELHQSNISRHLSQLRELDLLQDRREGTLAYYRWSESLHSSPELLKILDEMASQLSDILQLNAKVEEVLEQRRSQSEDFFERIAGKYRQLVEPGGSAQALTAAFAGLLGAARAVDIGCGEGDLTLLLARGCKEVISIDRSAKMLKVVEERCREAQLKNVKTKKAKMEQLPVEEKSADLVVMSQVLHHAAEPSRAIDEMARVLKVGGRFALLDLLAHDQEWTRERLGDLWLGFRPEQLVQWLTSAGLTITYTTALPVDEGLPVLLYCGEKR